eukprot:GILJ01006859.1.p1 GENE.GILJ01006859.1~~GILJ01006859.1.p1  ORF type:complete len:151 (-),score=27.17 GILJ01006859.1:124-525(-)
MEDAELAEIRARRMAEMQAAGGMRGGPGTLPSQEETSRQSEQKQEMEDRRRMMLMQLLNNDARERLSRIALVKPDKARKIEDMLISAAQRGQLNEKITEPKLVQMLEQINEVATKETKITFKRRTFDDEDDDF